MVLQKGIFESFKEKFGIWVGFESFEITSVFSILVHSQTKGKYRISDLDAMFSKLNVNDVP